MSSYDDWPTITIPLQTFYIWTLPSLLKGWIWEEKSFLRSTGVEIFKDNSQLVRSGNWWMWWFGYEVTLRWFRYEVSYVDAVIMGGEMIGFWYMWHNQFILDRVDWLVSVVEKWGLIGGGGSLRMCSGRIHLPCGPPLLLFSLPLLPDADMSWETFLLWAFLHVVLPHCGPRSVESAIYGLRPLK